VAFNSDACGDLATQFLSLAEKQGATAPLMVGHQILGISVMSTGALTEARSHYDQALSLYDTIEHRPLSTRFGQDSAIIVLSRRSKTVWFIGYLAAFVDLSTRSVMPRDRCAATDVFTWSYAIVLSYQSGITRRKRCTLSHRVGGKGNVVLEGFL
jgi:hypothetical protein